ncbi:hypothetical protein CONCODRAFT_167911, partial [Conidiobolus coronatus NRRL 28638]
LTVYEITRPKILSGEWKINCTKLDKEYSIDYNFVTPTLLQDTSKNPIGKIFSDKTFSLRRRIDLTTKASIVRTVWNYNLRTFPIEGGSDIQGFDKINWIWKKIGFNTKLVLEDVETGEKLAEFDRKRFSTKYIGDISIFKDLPEDINWLIVFSGSYCVKMIKNEEKSI